MNIIEKIKCLDHLTPNEAVLKDYLLENLDSVIDLSKNEIKVKLYISDSIIYRFCRKLDINGYDELRIQIASSLLKHNKRKNEKDVDFNFPFTKDDLLDSICEKIAIIYKSSVDWTLSALDYNELAKSIYYLNKSKTVCLFTPNSTNEMAQGFMERIKDLNKNIKISTSPYDWKVDSYNLSINDVVIINSYAGTSSDIYLKYLPKLHKKKVPIILIASSHNKDFFKYATCKLLICDKERPVEKLHSYSSNISIQFIFDILYSGLYQKNYEDNYNRRKYIYEK